jgi:hypothetical protein
MSSRTSVAHRAIICLCASHVFQCVNFLALFMKHFIKECLSYVGAGVSSVSIVSDYGLDDRAIGVRSPAGTKDFSSNLCVQTGSEAHPASCTMGTDDLFPG